MPPSIFLYQHSLNQRGDMTYRFLPSKNMEAGVKLLACSLINFLQEQLKKSNVVNVLVSGGNTPLAIYKEILDSYPTFSWSKCRIIVVDERFVPFESARSNSGQCYRNFIQHSDVFEFVYPDTSLAINDCVSSYSNLLSSLRISEIDIALLGTAGDGHLASIFPNVLPFAEDGYLFACERLFENEMETRISFTLDFINQSKNIWMMAFGADKEKITRKAQSLDVSNLPALNLPKNKSTLWFYDEHGK